MTNLEALKATAKWSDDLWQTHKKTLAKWEWTDSIHLDYDACLEQFSRTSKLGEKELLNFAVYKNNYAEISGETYSALIREKQQKEAGNGNR